MQSDLVVAVRLAHQPARKLVRVVATRDGSFSVVAYHPAASARLMKFATPKVLVAPGEALARPITTTMVDGKIKLSVHSSGFVQFSAASKTRVSSGRSSLGVPKGVGVNAHSLLDPIDSGATWGVTFFQVAECDMLSTDQKGKVFVFDETDLIERDRHDGASRHVFTVEGKVFSGIGRRDAYLGKSGWLLDAPYGSEHPERTATFRVFDLPVQAAFLGILVSVHHAPTTSQGGYILSGPKDIASGFYLVAEAPSDASDPNRVYALFDPAHEHG